MIRRLDSVLDGAKGTALQMKKTFDKEGILNQNDALYTVSGQVFCNGYQFTLKELRTNNYFRFCD
ncbi:hypothetical protein KGF45_17430 [Clostridioides sp. ZZV14-6154]|uniref:hypothetical protein n=1 Tax=unclassified Clostridioides TaxID=2635829 RepID=UPI001D106344|nr:hypothetical protein [Clostridioides sp. ZZV14-6154]MCC0670119.1 hypothetical protein [Clostridioides sp. ZZV14-6153]MCC0739172.1 hypothetical protein [Clostridioides sp. ZZV14-5902]